MTFLARTESLLDHQPTYNKNAGHSIKTAALKRNGSSNWNLPRQGLGLFTCLRDRELPTVR